MSTSIMQSATSIVRRLTCVSLVLMLVGLTACGQKGPLFLPGSEQDPATQGSTPAPSAEAQAEAQGRDQDEAQGEATDGQDDESSVSEDGEADDAGGHRL